eukprot:TRINITY_DN2821_c0_g1_i4.p1 TRINITY_DN2821_c0_g1~~TRINITY_DN2821_c0_g1_i4.p1  ORF type:complete len:162 (-),score=2.14 TRINITY_DN2821_c0_g1_i4:108-593(-)
MTAPPLGVTSRGKVTQSCQRVTIPSIATSSGSEVPQSLSRIRYQSDRGPEGHIKTSSKRHCTGVEADGHRPHDKSDKYAPRRVYEALGAHTVPCEDAQHPHVSWKRDWEEMLVERYGKGVHAFCNGQLVYNATPVKKLQKGGIKFVGTSAPTGEIFRETRW